MYTYIYIIYVYIYIYKSQIYIEAANQRCLSTLLHVELCGMCVLQCVAVCVAVCCSVLQYILACGAL